MSNEKKQGFFSRILKTPSPSETDSSPLGENNSPDENKVLNASSVDNLETGAVNDTAEQEIIEAPVEGRGIFKIPSNSMLFYLWNEWQRVAGQPETEAKLVMEKTGIVPVPMSDKELEEEKQRLASKLLTEAKKRYRFSHPQNTEAPLDMDADAIVYVSKNGLGAWLFIFPPVGEGNDISFENIQEAVFSETVTYGVDVEKLLNISQQQSYFELFVIARGLPMIPGKDGWIKEKFSHQIDNAITVDEHGNTDYRSIANMQVIHEGDILAEAFPPTEGVAGMTVLGTIIPPKSGKQVYLSGGFHTTLSEDKLKLLAAMDGHLTYRNGVFHVQPIYNVMGNVDYGVGNLDFPGDIHITGDVKNGFVVKAKGNVTIDGMVEGAIIEAGGDIIIRKGVLGDGRAVIKSEKSVHAQFLENCVVYAKDSVSAGSILTANVFSDNEVVVRTGRGTIIGGKIAAANLISANVIGSRSERLTELFVGEYPFVMQEREEHNRVLEQTEKELQEVEKNIRYLDKTDDPVEDVQKAMNHAQLLAKQRLQKNILTIKKEKILKQLKDLEQRRVEVEKCRIVCETIYPITRVKIGETEQTIEKMVYHCNIRLKQSEDRLVLG